VFSGYLKKFSRRILNAVARTNFFADFAGLGNPAGREGPASFVQIQEAAALCFMLIIR
jgi:hypothetical protein